MLKMLPKHCLAYENIYKVYSASRSFFLEQAVVTLLLFSALQRTDLVQVFPKVVIVEGTIASKKAHAFLAGCAPCNF